MSRDTFVGRWLFAAACLPVLVTFAAWTLTATGQDVKKPEKPAAKKEGEKKEGEKKAKGRLPNNYAKLVDEAQKTKIYAIQDKYDDQISKLEAEVKSLRSQRDAEIEGVLTAEQKERLQKLIADAKAEQEAKKKAAEAKKEGEKKEGEKKPEAPKATK